MRLVLKEGKFFYAVSHLSSNPKLIAMPFRGKGGKSKLSDLCG
jgi:hypothetical protein